MFDSIYLNEDSDVVKINGETYKVGEKIIHKFRGSGSVSILEEKNPDPSSIIMDLELKDPVLEFDEIDTIEVSIVFVKRKYD